MASALLYSERRQVLFVVSILTLIVNCIIAKRTDNQGHHLSEKVFGASFCLLNVRSDFGIMEFFA
jgi:hypothetical protein